MSTRSRVAIVLAVDRKLRREGDQASKVTVSPDVMASPKERTIWSNKVKKNMYVKEQFTLWGRKFRPFRTLD